MVKASCGIPSSDDARGLYTDAGELFIWRLLHRTYGRIGNAILPMDMAEHTPSICLMLSEHWRYVEL
ncbi:MAG: hypothetical protein MJZ12_07975 [Prevotella sp.]|nr:hypothetical protein [Prevotella sp.]